MNIPCQTHQNEYCLYLKIPTITEKQQPITQFLLCARCITEGITINCRSLILISDIASNTSTNYFANWPFLDGEEVDLKPHQFREVLGKIFNNTLIEQTQDNQEKIKVFMSQLKNKLVNQLDHIEKNMIEIQMQVIKDIQKVKSDYSQINNVEDIKNILQMDSDQQLSNNVASRLSEFFNKQNEPHTLTRSSIYSDLDVLLKRLSFDLDKNLGFIEYVLQSGLVQAERQLQEELQNCLNEKKEISKGEQNVKEIMKLISNRTNFCSELFLKEMDKLLMKNQLAFGGFDMNSYREEQHYQILNFSHYDDSQFSRLKSLVLNQAQFWKDFSENQFEITSTFTASFLLKLKDVFSPKSYHLLKHILYEYPVLDSYNKFILEDKLDFDRISSNQMSEITKLIDQFDDTNSYTRVLDSFSFQQSSKYLGMIISYKNNQVQINQNSKLLQKCYSKEFIENDQIYCVKIRIRQMQRLGNGHILIGVIPDESKESKMHDQPLQKTFVWNSKFGCKDFLKGEDFYELKGTKSYFYIYFSIKYKFFFVCNSSYSSVNYNKEAEFEENMQYRLCISINNGFRDQTLEILEINKLDI